MKLTLSSAHILNWMLVNHVGLQKIYIDITVLSTED